MAKENFVLLIGSLQGVPKISKQGDVAKLSIKTLRRTDKYDFPIIRVLDEKIIKELETYKENDFLVVKGILVTKDTTKKAKCPQCGEVISVDSTITDVIAISIVNIGTKTGGEQGRPYTLEDFKETSNVIRILGTLCRDPEFTTTKGNNPVSLCKYQIALNRKFRVPQEKEVFSDYPWVNSFSNVAEQDMIHLEKGSQVLIDGGLQTRSIKRNFECQCGHSFKAADVVMEIVPFSVEYLNNCKFD